MSSQEWYGILRRDNHRIQSGYVFDERILGWPIPLINKIYTNKR